MIKVDPKDEGLITLNFESKKYYCLPCNTDFSINCLFEHVNARPHCLKVGKSCIPDREQINGECLICGIKWKNRDLSIKHLTSMGHCQKVAKLNKKQRKKNTEKEKCKKEKDLSVSESTPNTQSQPAIDDCKSGLSVSESTPNTQSQPPIDDSKLSPMNTNNINTHAASMFVTHGMSVSSIDANSAINMNINASCEYPKGNPLKDERDELNEVVNKMKQTPKVWFIQLHDIFYACGLLTDVIFLLSIEFVIP